MDYDALQREIDSKITKLKEVLETETATIDATGNMEIRFTFEAAPARQKPAKQEGPDAKDSQ